MTAILTPDLRNVVGRTKAWQPSLLHIHRIQFSSYNQYMISDLRERPIPQSPAWRLTRVIKSLPQAAQAIEKHRDPSRIQQDIPNN